MEFLCNAKKSKFSKNPNFQKTEKKMKIRNEQMKKVNRERQTLIYIFVIKLQFNTLYIKKKNVLCQ